MGIWSRLAKTVRGGHHGEDIQEELQFHLDMDAADGHDYRQTRLRLGNMTRIREETRAVGIIEWLDSAGRDARYGVRQLLRTPALSLAVVLSLAIGLGANAAIFSLVDAAILKPLPVNAPDSLVILEWTNDGFPPEVENHNGEYIAYRRRSLQRLVDRRASLSAPGARANRIRVARRRRRLPRRRGDCRRHAPGRTSQPPVREQQLLPGAAGRAAARTAVPRRRRPSRRGTGQSS